MKKTTLFKTVLLLCALIVGSNSLWADNNYTITFANSANSATGISSTTNASTVIANDGSRSYVTTHPFTVNSGNCYYGDTKSCIRIGKTGNASSLSIALSAAGKVNATTIVVNCNNTGGKNNSDATLSVNETVAQTTTETADDYTFTINNNIESITLEGSASIRIYSITVNYIEDTRTAVNMSTFSATKSTLVIGETTSTTVTNNQPGWTAAYTYSSDDTDVATVSDEGVITAKEKGTATITASLNVDPSDENYKAGTTTSMTVEITVKNPDHTATFYVNGTVYDTEDVEEGESMVFPSDPSSLGGKSFVGWKKSSGIVGTTDDAPTLVTKASEKMGDADVSYYAVFATKAINSEEVTKSYGFETESDDDWTISNFEQNSSYHNTGSYSGYTNKANSYVTFNHKVNVKSFSFAFTRTSGNNNYYVYVETSTDNSDWSAAETYSMSTFNSDGTFSTKTKTFDGTKAYYVRFHCYNTSAARYVDDVSITYDDESITYSAYCTDVTTSVDVTTYGWATFNSDYALDLTGVDFAYIVEGVNGTASGSTVTLNQVTEKVAANTPLLIKGTVGTPLTQKIPVTDSGNTLSGNKLVAVTANDTDVEAEDGHWKYVLAVQEGKAVFAPIGGTKATLKKGQAYLDLNSEPGVSAHILYIDWGVETTGINKQEVPMTFELGSFYDLQGRRVERPAKGLYIMNGKKAIIK